MNFINDEIKINFAIPVNIQDFVEIAEKADKENIKKMTLVLIWHMQMRLMLRQKTLV